MANWHRFKEYLFYSPSLGLQLDISHMEFDDQFFTRMEPAIQKAFDEMSALEGGAIANPDENRMVGHYWLRTPNIAPNKKLQEIIESTTSLIKDFSAKVHTGTICTPSGNPFKNLLVIGIGGSTLGPQLVADALVSPTDKLATYFFDNTDPDGMDRVLDNLGKGVSATLVVVISKSGGTKETRNGMLEAKEAFKRHDLDFRKYAVAVTGDGSELDKLAQEEGWLARFPMWDWVGGRTSELSAVGLLPAALQGIDIDCLLEGARSCDAATRNRMVAKNPAALLALMWYHASSGHGAKDMVVLPYKDRLLLFSRYLQQLIMESLGKELDLQGNVVHQGLTVYGNKGSTDQHAYVQQLRDGLNNFFVTFIEVLHDRRGLSIKVDPDSTSGDYLFGFLQGTRQALHEKGRASMTISLEKLDATGLGILIALYERAVGLYASLISVNAYHQPGVEAGKRAAGAILDLQRNILAFLRNDPSRDYTVEEVAIGINKQDAMESIFAILRHLAANPDHSVRSSSEEEIFSRRYRAA